MGVYDSTCCGLPSTCRAFVQNVEKGSQVQVHGEDAAVVRQGTLSPSLFLHLVTSAFSSTTKNCILKNFLMSLPAGILIGSTFLSKHSYD